MESSYRTIDAGPDVVVTTSTERCIALFSGLVVITAVGWILMLLGAALGISLVAAQDTLPTGETISLTAVLWVIASWILAYFAGSMIMSRMSGVIRRSTGMQLAVALWGLGISVTLIIGSLGLGSILRAGSSIASGAGSVIEAAADHAGETPSNALTTLKSSVSRDLQVALKREARISLGVRDEAVGSIDRQTLTQLESVDNATLIAAAAELLADRPEGARGILQLETSLSDPQIDQLINATKGKATELRERLQRAKEDATKYAQVGLWLAFIGAALALVASIAGSRCGCTLAHRYASARANGVTTTIVTAQVN